MNLKVNTITLNPCFDKTLLLEDIIDDVPNRVISEIQQASGKGVNVSKILRKFGLETRTFLMAGKANANAYFALLDDNAGKIKYIPLNGSIRENITIRTQKNKTIKINRAGAHCTENDIMGFQKLVSSSIKPGEFAIMSGSLTNGLSADRAAELCRELTRKSVKLCIDCEMLTAAHFKTIKPFMIKPNKHEFKRLTGSNLESIETIKNAAKNLIESGAAEYIIVSLGADGLLCATKNQSIKISVPDLKIKSSVGAGDSVMSGFVYGMLHNWSLEKTARFAGACGTATAILEGTHLADLESAEKILPDCIAEV